MDATMNGGRDIVLAIDGGATETVKVMQLKLRQYEAAFLLLDDEIALTAFLCGKKKDWAFDLLPESYELARATAQDVNEAGFFVYSARQREKMTRALNQVKPEVLRAAAESLSQGSRPGLRPRAA